MPKLMGLSEVTFRQMVLPAGTTVRVPSDHEWILTAISVLPSGRYSPPIGGSERNPLSWGDVQIRLADGRVCGRANVLTLMDRYWGRYNLNPGLREAVAKLDEIDHVLTTAPTIFDLAHAAEAARVAVTQYFVAATPRLEPTVLIKGEREFTIEHVDCESGPARTKRPIYVELLIVTHIPVQV